MKLNNKQNKIHYCRPDCQYRKMKLTIRTANQEFDDLNIECSEELSVKELKVILSQEHPAVPSVADQRLICSGRLLADHALLKDTLIHYGNVTSFIVHLVCKSVLEQKNKLETTKPTKHQEPVFPNPATFSSYSAPVVTGQTGFYWPAPAVSNYPVMSSWDSQHAVWMHSYAAYMNEYFQRLNSTGVPITPIPMTPLPMNNIPAPSTPLNLPAVNDPPQPENPPAGQAENALRRRPGVAAAPQAQNINGGIDGGMLGAAQVDAENGEAEVNRDWLDWMYMLTRLGILVCFAFLYSSLSRIVGVILFGCMAYLYQRRIRVVQQRRVVNLPPPPAVVVPEPAPPVVEEDDNNNSNEPNPDQVNNNIPQGMENNPELHPERVVDPPQPGVVDVLKTALVAFVTSIIPDHQNIFN